MKAWITPESAKYLQIGLELSGSVLIGFFAGYFIDRKLGWTPVCTLIGFFVGVAAGFWRFFRLVNADQERNNSSGSSSSS